MSIHCNVVQKTNPSDKDEAPKYYLSAKSLGSISREELISDMVRHTSLTKQEASTAVDYLFESIPRFLQLGFTVQLGNLGYFKITLRSEGSTTPGEATVDKIKGKYIRFIPGKALRESLKSFSFEKVKN